MTTALRSHEPYGVIPTDEELMIARTVFRIAGADSHAL